MTALRRPPTTCKYVQTNGNSTIIRMIFLHTSQTGYGLNLFFLLNKLQYICSVSLFQNFNLVAVLETLLRCRSDSTSSQLCVKYGAYFVHAQSRMGFFEIQGILLRLINMPLRRCDAVRDYSPVPRCSVFVIDSAGSHDDTDLV